MREKTRTAFHGSGNEFQLPEFLPYHRDQGRDGLAAEIEFAAGGGEEFRQRTRAAQRQSFLVIRQRGGFAALPIYPDLEGAQLRDAVLDVVERMNEDVQLAVP